ncbi:MAG: hypothetical protein Q9217_003121 [Psora testacea]
MRCLPTALVAGGLVLYQVADVATVSQDPGLAIIARHVRNGLIRTAAQPLGVSFSSQNSRRDTSHPLYNGDCSPVPGPQGPMVSPDTAEAFLASERWKHISENATTPNDYELAFANAQAINASPDVLGSLLLESYDPGTCAIQCDGDSSCMSFTVAAVRAPSVLINAATCPNPPSITRFECTFSGSRATKAPPPSEGICIAQFHVVWAGANVYNKIAPSKRSTSDHESCNGGPVIHNGGFEMDNPSQQTVPIDWDITSVAPTVTFGFTKPGSVNQGGTYAFVANLLAPDLSIPNPSTGFILSQDMNICPGHNYSIGMDYRFDDPASGNCSITLAYHFQDTLNMTTSASGDAEGNKPHTWITMRVFFQAVSQHGTLAILVDCVGNVWNNYSIDNVVVELIDEPAS